MNQIAFLLQSGTIQLYAKRDLKLTRLSGIISLYLAKFMKHNKLNTTFLHEIVIIFSLIYSSVATQLISSFNLRTRVTRVNSRSYDYLMNLGHLRGKQYTQHSLITPSVQTFIYFQIPGLLDNFVLGFSYSNLIRETGGLELKLTIRNHQNILYQKLLPKHLC